VSRLELNGLSVEVVRKPIKHMHLGVYPPEGRVRIAAPKGTPTEVIRLFAIGKLPWIRRQQARFAAQARDSPLEYIERESHYLWGKRYLLRVFEVDAAPAIRLRAKTIDLQVRPGADLASRRDVIETWYRNQLREALPPLLDKWQRLLNVRPKRIHLQRMKTKWGSCNSTSRSIRLNTELAKKPAECLEYVLMHELTHLVVRNHGDRFVRILDRAMPQWREIRDVLNLLPLGPLDS
jgi:hypothetical protein